MSIAFFRCCVRHCAAGRAYTVGTLLRLRTVEALRGRRLARLRPLGEPGPRPDRRTYYSARKPLQASRTPPTAAGISGKRHEKAPGSKRVQGLNSKAPLPWNSE